MVLSYFQLVSAQEGMQMQYFNDGEHIMQDSSILRQNKVKEIRFVLVNRKRHEILDTAFHDTSRTFFIRGGFEEGFGDAVAEIDSLTGRISSMMTRRTSALDFEYYNYNSLGQLSNQIFGYTSLTSQFLNRTDSIDLTYDIQGRLETKFHDHNKFTDVKRSTNRYLYNPEGDLIEEIYLLIRFDRKRNSWSSDTLIQIIEIEHLKDKNGQLIRSEYRNKGKVWAMDSMIYSPGGRLISLMGWDRLHPQHPQFRKLLFNGTGQLSSLLIQYPHHRRRKRVEFTYNEYGLLMEYSFFNKKNRAMVMELHYDFYP